MGLQQQNPCWSMSNILDEPCFFVRERVSDKYREKEEYSVSVVELVEMVGLGMAKRQLRMMSAE